LLRDSDIVEELNTPDDQKWTPMQYAASYGNLDVFLLLLSMKNINFEFAGVDGAGIVHHMVRNKSDDLDAWKSILLILKKKGYNFCLENIYGATALHEAALRSNVVATTALVTYTELPNLVIKRNSTTLCSTWRKYGKLYKEDMEQLWMLLKLPEVPILSPY
jgi:ankyrin repeat protein